MEQLILTLIGVPLAKFDNSKMSRQVLVKMPSGSYTYAQYFAKGKKQGWWGYDGSQLEGPPSFIFPLPDKGLYSKD